MPTKPKSKTIDASLDERIKRLCSDLSTLNERYINKHGEIMVGAGRVANWKHESEAILKIINEAPAP